MTTATRYSSDLASQRRRMLIILGRLAKEYPGKFEGLNFTTPFQLLIATILSAQCTDERVNSITPKLFATYRTPEDFASIPLEKLAQDIKPTGYYNAKARNIQACCRILIEKFGGTVPRTREELIQLPGVGRKTANVVLSQAFGEQTITVDTHVGRLANRLGFVTTPDPLQIETALMDITPQQRWNDIGNLFITHGRKVCTARKPHCDRCILADLCPSALVIPQGKPAGMSKRQIARARVDTRSSRTAATSQPDHQPRRIRSRK
ncbi:MAG: endonuclease III [Chlorobi bacterium]|nr:endonuclease III [Chlorobiota bacterium]